MWSGCEGSRAWQQRPETLLFPERGNDAISVSEDISTSPGSSLHHVLDCFLAVPVRHSP